MKRLLVFTILMLSVVIVMAQQKKPRVGVYMTGSDPVNEIVSNRLTNDLLIGGKYTPVERSEEFLKLVSKEQNYQHSGEVDDDQIAALGKQLGLEYVCVVSVVDVWGSEKYITAHIIDVNSAEVVGTCSSNGTLTTSQQMMSALDDLSRNLTNALDYSKQSTTTKVAVYVTRSGNKDVDIILADQLVSAFSKSGKYIAVERTDSFLKQLSKEVGYQQSGAVDDNDLIAELGKRFGVQYVCVAKTTSLFGAYYITARLINVEKAQVSGMYNAENRLLQNSHDVLWVAQEIAERLANYSADIDEIFEVVEEDPEFPGGMDAMYQFLADNIKYPQLAKENNIQGTVYLSFVIEKDGSISDIRVFGARQIIIDKDGNVSRVSCEQLAGGCTEEAIRAVRKMPRWKPGMQRRTAVRVRYNLPISFKLQ